MQLKEEINALDYDTSFSKLALDIIEGVVTDSSLPDALKRGITTVVGIPRSVLKFVNEKGLPVL